MLNFLEEPSIVWPAMKPALCSLFWCSEDAAVTNARAVVAGPVIDGSAVT